MKTGGDKELYLLYLDHELFPVAPERIVTETGIKNRTVSLIDGSEVALMGGRSLKKFSFELLLPMSEYPFAVYDGGFKDATYYIDKLEQIANKDEPIWFDVYRTLPDMEKTYLTNVFVVPEKIAIEENAENGMDMKASVVLREYRRLEAGIVSDGTIYALQTRTDDMEVPDTYTVMQGDSLWMIAKKYLGSGEKYVYLAQINSIKSPYTINPGQVIKLRE